MTAQRQPIPLAEAAALCGLVALAVWLRWDNPARGITDNEYGMLQPISVRGMLLDPENGINPPLLRVLFNGPFTDYRAFYYGSWVSLWCGVLAVPAGWGLGRALGGQGWRGTVAGLMTALAVAVHPMFVSFAGIYRSYAFLLPLMLLHLACVARIADGSRTGRSVFGASVTAVVMPWLHYTAAPLLLVEGAYLAWAFRPPRRAWLAMYAPSALLALPLLNYVVFFDALRIPSASTAKVVAFMTTAGIRWTGDLRWIGLHGAFALLVIVGWRRWSAGQKVVAVWGGVAWLVPVLISMEHIVRPPTAHLVAVAFVPLVCSLPASVLAPRPMVAAFGALLLLYTPAMMAEHRSLQALVLPANAAPEVAVEWTRFEDVRRGGPIYLVGDRFGRRLAFYLFGYHPQRLTPERLPCGVQELDCFSFSGVTFKPLGDRTDPGGLVISAQVNRGAVDGDVHHAPAACEPVFSRPAWTAFDCGSP